MNSSPPPFAVIILAGGEGRRIGGGKPQRRLAGTTLLDRALALASSWSAEVAVAIRHPAQAPAGVDVVIDDPAIDGPLSGLLAALRRGRSRGCHAVLTIPCDMPFLPADLPERLLKALAETGPSVAVAASGEHLHPVCAMWTPDAEATLLREAAAGRLSLTNLTEQLNRRVVHWPIADVEHFRFSPKREKSLSFCFDAFSSREAVPTSLENAIEHFRFSPKREKSLSFCFDAFSSREAVPTSLENAIDPFFNINTPEELAWSEAFLTKPAQQSI